VVSTVIDYFLGLKIRQIRKKYKKAILIGGLLNNLLILFVFKYLYFFTSTVNTFFEKSGIGLQVPGLRLLLPIGISYYTFKKISYLVDIYRGNIEPEKHVGIFMLYVAFFPSLLAGPIDRAGKLLPQFKQKNRFDFDRMKDGSIQMLWGFFKKLVIADNLAPYVNKVFNNPQGFEGIHFILAALFFSIQIYCDFSGYSDIAIGSARVMGFKLMDNFNRPYHAASITDFWSRWHISFSTWLRDYLFLPISYSVSRRIKSDKLLGLRADKWAYILGIMATMLLCGLWHGANWTFVLWGGLHGVYIGLAFVTRRPRAKIRKRLKIKKSSRLHKVFSIFFTFGFVSFAWIFFKANTISDAVYITSNLFSGIPHFFQTAFSFLTNLDMESLAGFLINNTMGVTNFHLIFVIFAVFFMEFGEIRQGKKANIAEAICSRPIWTRWSFYYILIFAVLFFTRFEAQEFIYFQF
jgi:D-alanyl-lipoteichoic acid acyltransferase DltB (MBOAT superfamily)